MRKINVEIPVELSDNIQKVQVEMDGLKQLIGYLLATEEYVIPAKKIEKLQEDFMAKNKIYNELKLKVEDYIPEDFDKNKTSWMLDFSTHTVEITEE